MWNETRTFRAEFSRKIRNGPRFKMRWNLFRFVPFFELVWNVSAIPDETEWNWQPWFKARHTIPTNIGITLLCSLKILNLLWFVCYVFMVYGHELWSFEQCFKTRPGPAGRPGSVAGPGLSKKQAGNWPGQTRSTRRVDPGPGRPGQTRLRPGFIFFYILMPETTRAEGRMHCRAAEVRRRPN